MSIRIRGANFLISTLILLVLFGSTAPGRAIPVLTADNPIVTENQQPGSDGWLHGPALADDTTGQIKGYASATSVGQGQSITLFVSVNPAQSYSMDFYRMGWYGGLGGRLRLHVDALTSTPQQACLADPSTGLIGCNWQPSYTLTIPPDWTSGVYVTLLTNAQGYQNYVIFVVKDGRPAPFLYQQSVTTYQAYNNYPDDGVTGKSLYTYNSYGANTVAGDARAVKVSFDRPYSAYGSGQFFWFEIYFIRWLERSGYDVTYSTDVDTHANGGELRNHKAFLSIGHDEYWSKEMFDAAQSARDAGVDLGFFTANAAFWQIRFEPSASGVANRVIVCYRDARLDPVQGPTTTVNFRSAPVTRPEQTLEGIQYTSLVNFPNNVPYVVTSGSHWVYAGTGFKDGDAVPGIVGYEMDRYMPDYPLPSFTSRTLLSQSPFTNNQGLTDYANSSIYQAPSGAWVFAAGTVEWSWGLDNVFPGDNAADSRIQKTTANILNAFLNGAPVVTHFIVGAPASVTAGQPFTLTVIAEDSLGNPVPQYNGTVHFSSTDTSSGGLLPPDSTLTNGQGNFTATLDRAGWQTITSADAVNPTIAGTVTVPVSAASAASVSLAVPSNVKANQPFNAIVKLLDRFGNVATGYTGTVHFSTSDAATQSLGGMPADFTFASADAGNRTFSVTLRSPPSQTISVTDRANASLTAASPPITVSLF